MSGKLQAKIRDARPMKEWQLHFFVADLLRLQGRECVIWYHCPNEGRRSPRTGAFLKRLGMRAGVPDFAFVLPGGKSAFLELKRPGEYPSANQRVFARQCASLGVPYAVARSPEEARTILENWDIVLPARREERHAA